MESSTNLQEKNMSCFVVAVQATVLLFEKAYGHASLLCNKNKRFYFRETTNMMQRHYTC